MSPDRPRNLQLIHSAPAATDRVDHSGWLTLPATPALEQFLSCSAARGLADADALRLAIERDLALADAHAFGFDRRAARHLLNARASRARVERRLDPADAAYVRLLSAAPAVAPAQLGASLSVELPRTLLSRARGVVSTFALELDAIREMVPWEIAARLERRSIGEWALLVLATQRRAAAG